MSPAAPGPGVSCPAAGRTRCCVGQGSARSPGGAAPSPLPPVSSTAGDRGAFLTPPCSAMSPAECQPHSSSSNAPISWGCGDTVRALLCPRCPPCPLSPPGAALLPCPCAAGMRRLLPAVLWLPPPSSSLPGGQSSAACAPTHTPHRFPARLPAVFGAATGSRLGCERLLGAQPPKASERCVWPVPRLSFRSRTVLGLQLANASVCT